MKILKFDNELVPPILNKEKTITWRLFDDKNIQTNDKLEFINKQTGETFAHAIITSTREKPISKKNQNDYQEGHEQYESPEHMIQTFKKYYGNAITPQTPIKIIAFTLTK